MSALKEVAKAKQRKPREWWLVPLGFSTLAFESKRELLLNGWGHSENILVREVLKSKPKKGLVKNGR